MWPLYVSQLAFATAPEARPLVPLDDETGRMALYRAVAWADGDAGDKTVLFAVERAIEADVVPALERGAVCVLPERWTLDLGAELRRRVLVSANPLAAFRLFAAFIRSRL